MGLESANYHFCPVSSASAEMVDVLARLGATEQKGDSHRHFILRGDSHWIDFKLGDFSAVTAGGTLSIRVALCNPNGVGAILRRVFQELLQVCGGQVIDKDSKMRFVAMGDIEWSELWRSYQMRRESFRKAFGNMEASISGDDVFERMKDRG